MAVTLDAHKLTYMSMPIVKTEETDEGIVVYGKASDGRVDSDDQIVDPKWSGPAIAKWLDTGGNVRVQHNPQLYPAGRGLSVELDRDGDGGHWVKSLVVEPIAMKLVRAGVLRAYSVGIAKPIVRRDMTSKARGGIVAGGEVAEISLVDRPANTGCGITLVKSEGDDAPWTYGDLVDALVKAEAAELSDKAGAAKADDTDGGTMARQDERVQEEDEPADDSQADANGPDDEGTSATENPDDLKKAYVAERAAWVRREPGPGKITAATGTAFLAKRAAEDQWRAWHAEGEQFATFDSWLAKRNFDRGVGGGVDRDKLDESSFADPENRKFPIVSPGDVEDAAGLAGHAKNPGKVRRRIRAIARRKGPEYEAKLPDSWQDGDGPAEKNFTTDSPLASGLAPYNLVTSDDDEDDKKDMVEPDLTKAAGCPKCGARFNPKAPPKRCPNCGKKLARMVAKGVAAALAPYGDLLVKAEGVHHWKHGWIWIGPGQPPEWYQHMGRHHEAMAGGRFDDAREHLSRAATALRRAGGETNHAHASEVEVHGSDIGRNSPVGGKGKVTAAERKFHTRAAMAHDAAARGDHEAAERHAKQAHAESARLRQARVAEPKPEKGPGHDVFDGRPRSAWMAEARQAGVKPPRNAPAHEIARMVGEHHTRRAAAQSHAIRSADTSEMFTTGSRGDLALRDQRRQRHEQQLAKLGPEDAYVQAAADRFNSEHQRKVSTMAADEQAYHAERAARSASAAQRRTEAEARRAARPPKEKKEPRPGIDQFDLYGSYREPERQFPRSTLQQMARDEGVKYPKGAPAHEIARHLTEHRAASAAADSWALRYGMMSPDELAAGETHQTSTGTHWRAHPSREQFIDSAVRRARGKHDEKVRGLGMADHRGLTEADHSEILAHMGAMGRGDDPGHRTDDHELADRAAEQLAADRTAGRPTFTQRREEDRARVTAAREQRRANSERVRQSHKAMVELAARGDRKGMRSMASNLSDEDLEAHINHSTNIRMEVPGDRAAAHNQVRQALIAQRERAQRGAPARAADPRRQLAEVVTEQLQAGRIDAHQAHEILTRTPSPARDTPLPGTGSVRSARDVRAAAAVSEGRTPRPAVLDQLEGMRSKAEMRRAMGYENMATLEATADHLGVNRTGPGYARTGRAARVNLQNAIANHLITQRAAQQGIRRVKTAGVDMAKSTNPSSDGKRLLPPDVSPAGPHREPDGSAVEELEADAGMPTDHDTTEDQIPASVMKMHDAFCPVYDWADVADTHALKSIGEAVDLDYFTQAVLKAADQGDATGIVIAGTYHDNAAAIAKGMVDATVLTAARNELHKAFGDLNPQVMIGPQQFQRAYLQAGHAPLSAPSMRVPMVPPASHVIHPDDFHRGLITDGHQADSPSNGGDNMPVASVASGMGKTFYATATQQAAVATMRALHDHIVAGNTALCPLAASRSVVTPDMGARNRPAPIDAPVAAGITKAVTVDDEPDYGRPTLGPGEFVVTKKQLKNLVKMAVADVTEAVEARNEQQINELRQQLDELGSQPDLTQAPLRGAITKAATLGSSARAPVETSLVEKARKEAEEYREGLVAYLQRLASPANGNAGQRMEAQHALGRLLTTAEISHT
jgi:hypothetical protein